MRPAFWLRFSPALFKLLFINFNISLHAPNSLHYLAAPLKPRCTRSNLGAPAQTSLHSLKVEKIRIYV